MREPTLAGGYGRALMQLAVSKGASREALIGLSGIDPRLLEDQDSRLPLANYMALMRAGQALTGDAALALHFGEAFEIAEMSIVGLIGEACETLAEAFTQLDRYTRLLVDVEVDHPSGKRLVLMPGEAGRLWLLDTRKHPNAFPEMTESSFARMVCASQRAGNMFLVKEVHVTHKAPSYRAEYDRVLQVPVVFESDRNAILMGDDFWFAMKPPRPSRYVFGVLSARAESLLRELESATSMRGRVESVLMPMLHTGDVRMETVAGKLALSRPTLLRKLKAEGTTFEKVLDALRHRSAVDYLSGKKVSVNETAYLTGFSDPAAFSRAFKRWTGTTPRAFRMAPRS